MLLTIGEKEGYQIRIGNIDIDQEIHLEIGSPGSGDWVDYWINKEQSIQIINHLKEQFEI